MSGFISIFWNVHKLTGPNTDKITDNMYQDFHINFIISIKHEIVIIYYQIC